MSLLTYYVGAWLCFHLISLIDKVYCCRVRELGSSPVYTKNQLMFWPDGKNNHHGADAIGSNAIVII